MKQSKEKWTVKKHHRGIYDVITESGKIEYYELDKRTAEKLVKEHNEQVNAEQAANFNLRGK